MKSTPVPVCDGMRCELGNCVPWEKVCDGVSDCLNEQDETFEMCRVRTDKCKTNETLCSNYHNNHKTVVRSCVHNTHIILYARAPDGRAIFRTRICVTNCTKNATKTYAHLQLIVLRRLRVMLWISTEHVSVVGTRRRWER